jgi:DNA-binding CsgD family transcriptional regulator
MAQAIDAPTVCPILVGREGPLAALRARLDAARAGQGQVVLIAGEAGIGKSRLTAEAAASARERGLRVLAGQCFEPDRALPYAPWRDLVRTHLLDDPSAADALATAAPDLVALLPDLARGRPDLTPDARRAHELDQWRIVDAFVRLVAVLAAQTPLLLIVEDAHWGDEASLDLLLPLARRIAGPGGPPVALLVTYRDDEAAPPLAALLAALDRERLAAEARLGPLPRAEVMAMLHALSGQHGPLAASTAEAIFRLSEGNPFAVEELFRSTVAQEERAASAPDAGAPPPVLLPRTIAEAVARRVRRLSGDARALLTVAAVAGRRFDVPLLQTLTGCDEAALVERLKELLAARLVVEESADRFAFRHDLTRRAIEDGLLARERRALHRQILTALRARETRTPAADLARHAAAAGVWADALRYGQRAGADALRLYAPGAAVELLGLAVAAAGHLEAAPPAALLRARGQAHEMLGSFEAARDDYERAAALAREAGDRRAESEALLALGGLWAARDYAQSGPLIRHALVLAREAGDAALTARALNRLGNWHANREEPDQAFALHREALSLCEALADRRGIAETLDLIGIACYLTADYVGSAAAYRRAIPLLRELDDRRTLVNALTALVFTMSTLDSVLGVKAPGSHEERLAPALEAVAVAREIEGRGEEALAHCAAAMIVGERHLDRALDHTRQAMLIADQIEHRQWAAFARLLTAYLHRLLLDADGAHPFLAEALALARASGSTFWEREVRVELALTQMLAGELTAAEATIAETISDDTPMQTNDQREASLGWALIALAAGRPEQALLVIDRLIAIATPNSERDLPRLPLLALLRGEALLASGRSDEAAEALAAARDGARDQENLPVLWRTHLARATLCRRAGRRDDASRELDAAHAVVGQMADGIADPALAEGFRRRAAAHLPPQRPPSPRQAAKAAAGGLTARERDVALLIAAGKSNREIGEALFMTERTAATHVGHILAKLGVKTRAQIAAWAQERGLIGPGSPSPIADGKGG